MTSATYAHHSLAGTIVAAPGHQWMRMPLADFVELDGRLRHQGVDLYEHMAGTPSWFDPAADQIYIDMNVVDAHIEPALAQVGCEWERMLTSAGVGIPCEVQNDTTRTLSFELNHGLAADLDLEPKASVDGVHVHQGQPLYVVHLGGRTVAIPTDMLEDIAEPGTIQMPECRSFDPAEARPVMERGDPDSSTTTPDL
jgi:hypothetical protein